VNAEIALDLNHVLKTYVVDNCLEGEGEGLADDTPLAELNILDSTAILELVHYLRRELGVKVSLDDINPENFHSIRTICELVTRRMAS
jgi:acyl carrier protein